MMIEHKLKRGIGILRNIANNLRSKPVIVLTYHRVTRLPEDPHMLAVSPAHFSEQLKFLSENYPVLRFEDDWSSCRETAFVITFDDGYADNLQEALPLLEQYRIPATFFISSGAIDANQEFPWDGATCPQRRNYRTLRRNEFLELGRHPLVTIGSHTRNHPRLSELSAEAQLTEIRDGHHDLEQMLNRKLSVFSYPFGNYSDFTQQSEQACRATGILRAAANYPGQAHPQTNQWAIPRHLVRDWDARQFRAKIPRFFWL